MLSVPGGERTFLSPDALRPTAAGKAAAARWQGVARDLHEDESFEVLPPPAVAIWDRYLAYAVALGLARSAARGLPMGTDSTRTAWSAADGRWRHLRLLYPRAWPLGWGCRPASVVIVGLAGMAAAATVLALAAPIEALIAIIAAAALAWSTIVTARAALDLVRPSRTVTGEVVRLYVRHGRRSNPWQDLVPRRYYVVVDNGTARRLSGLVVRPATFYRLWEGDTVTAAVTPNLGYVRELARA